MLSGMMKTAPAVDESMRVTGAYRFKSGENA